jgi:anion-transporting  ArsA/GET3 family ATPase
MYFLFILFLYINIEKRKIMKIDTRTLQKQQQDVLACLYECRFATNKHIAMYLGRNSHKGVQKKLQILEEHGLIGKRYDKTYKIVGRSAEYYLTPYCARQLQHYGVYADSIDERAIKRLYKNRHVSDVFVDQCLHATYTVLKFKALYVADYEPFMPVDTKTNSHLPAWKPDIYITHETGGYAFFLDIEYDQTPFFILVRKVRNYLRYIEEVWLPETLPRPIFLFVCQTIKTKQKLQKQIERALEDSYDTETVFALTSSQEFYNATDATDKIWQRVTSTDEPTQVAVDMISVAN